MLSCSGIVRLVACSSPWSGAWEGAHREVIAEMCLAGIINQKTECWTAAKVAARARIVNGRRSRMCCIGARWR